MYTWFETRHVTAIAPITLSALHLNSTKTKVIYMERRTFRRIIRDRHLTEEEKVADEQIWSQVVQEFPPSDLAVPQAGCISEALRRAIQSSPKSVYQICKETGISQIVVSRFLSGERDIRLATADRLAKALGIEMVSH